MLLPCGSRQREEEGKEKHGMLLALAVGEQRPSSFVVRVQAKGQDTDTVESRCERQWIAEHRMVSQTSPGSISTWWF